VTEDLNDAGSERARKANVLLDGEQVYSPAITTYLNIGQDIGTPSVRTGLTKDVYLTVEPGLEPGDSTAVVRVFVKPMILWLWIGGLIMAIGTLLAAFPSGRRRDPLSPVSAPIGDAALHGDAAPVDGEASTASDEASVWAADAAEPADAALHDDDDEPEPERVGAT
jgi:cytochrome c-type biogenesis protein CcmF